MIELFAHQKACREFLKGRNFAALLMDMGTGKSLTILTHIIDNKLMPAMIVTKNSIKYNWTAELEKLGVTKDDYVVLEGSTEKKREQLADTSKKFYIMNFESVRLIKEDIARRKLKTLVLDESTAIKNPTAKVTKAVLTIARRVENRYILTGTPITNAPLDAFCQFNFLDPSVLFFYNYFAFRSYYAVCIERRINGRAFKDVVGYKNLDELVTRIQPHSFMIKKEDCLDLPPKVYETRYVDMIPEQARIYNELAKELVAEIEPNESVVASNILTKLLRLQQILGGHTVSENGVAYKLKENKTVELLEILEEIGDAKVVIWARFVDEIKFLEKLLNEKGYKTRSIHGEIETEQRQNIVNEINTGDLRIVVCQQQTAGFGLNITGASYAVYYSNDWSLQNRQQSEDRIYRIGQTKKVTIIDIIHKDTVEETIVAALKTKKTFQDIFFLKTEAGGSVTDFKDRIKQTLKGKEVK